MNPFKWLGQQLRKLLKPQEEKFKPKRAFFKKRKPIFLSKRVKSKADRKYAKLLKNFKRTHHGRQPTHNELLRIVINASHITIRRRGKSGHWGRQKIRKYLLEKHGIVDNFRMK
jgi:vacuolar-type H+-ATPase subunit C/Vma6